MPFFYDLPVEEIVAEVSRRMEIPRERMFSLTRDRQGAWGWGLVAYLRRKLGGCRVKDLADFWGREPTTLNEEIGKVEERANADEGFRHAVERMEKNFIRNRRKKYLITVA